MASSSPSPTKFHFAMFPWFAAGHLTPFFQLSTDLAERGHKITFLSPKKAITFLQPLNTYPDLIHFHPVSVPHVEGLPHGTETASEIPISSCDLLVTAMDLTRDQVEAALSASMPDFVLYDSAYWVPQVARPLGVISIYFNIVHPAATAYIGAPSRNVSKDKPLTVEQLEKPPPGYPSKTIVLHPHEAKHFMFVTLPFGGDGIFTFYDRMVTATIESDAIAMRACKELDESLCDYVASQFNKPLFYTGLALLEPPTDTKLEARWDDWLNRFNRGSVVFCALGSQWILEKDQFQEFLLGVELTNLPFLLALKPPLGCSTVEEAFPDGFEERTKGRGVVDGGWIQQTMILNHPSVGCFVSHGGFSSVWESLMCDNQLVLVPHAGDQILVTRHLAAELKVGVEIQREISGWFSKESSCKAIKSVMDQDSDLGRTLRRNQAHWKEKLTSPNFMSGYINNFMCNLEDLRSASYSSSA